MGTTPSVGRLDRVPYALSFNVLGLYLDIQLHWDPKCSGDDAMLLSLLDVTPQRCFLAAVSRRLHGQVQRREPQPVARLLQPSPCGGSVAVQGHGSAAQQGHQGGHVAASDSTKQQLLGTVVP